MSKSRDLSKVAPLIGDANNAGGFLGTSGTAPLIAYGRKNIVFNGNFDIWQRGTSFTPSANTVTYTADRWFGYRATSAAYTVSRVASTVDQHNLTMKVQRTAGDTTTNAINVAQIFESQDCKNLSGRTVTLSFYAYVGANFSGASSQISVGRRTGTGVDQSSTLFATNAWAGVVTTAPSVTLTTTPTLYSITFAMPSGVTQFGIQFGYVPVGMAGADDSFYIERVQLERNPTFTNFEYLPAAQTLALCQRYFEKLGGETNTYPYMYVYQSAGNSYSNSTPFKVTKRVPPTAALVGSFSLVNASSPSIGNVTTQGLFLTATASGTGGSTISLSGSGNYITADAEL